MINNKFKNRYTSEKAVYVVSFVMIYFIMLLIVWAENPISIPGEEIFEVESNKEILKLFNVELGTFIKEEAINETFTLDLKNVEKKGKFLNYLITPNQKYNGFEEFKIITRNGRIYGVTGVGKCQSDISCVLTEKIIFKNLTARFGKIKDKGSLQWYPFSNRSNKTVYYNFNKKLKEYQVSIYF